MPHGTMALALLTTPEICCWGAREKLKLMWGYSGTRATGTFCEWQRRMFGKKLEVIENTNPPTETPNARQQRLELPRIENSKRIVSPKNF